MKNLMEAARAAVKQFGKLTWRDRDIGYREWSALDDAVKECDERAEQLAAKLCELSHSFPFDSEPSRLLSDAADFLRDRS